jgi:transposase
VPGSSTARAPESPIGGWHGVDGAKKVNGRKRHLLVDTLGLLLRVRVTAGDVGDRDGAAMLLHDVRTVFPRLRYGWVDGGYRGAFLTWAKEVAGIALQVVQRRDGGLRLCCWPADLSAPSGSSHLKRGEATAKVRWSMAAHRSAR